MDGAPACGRQMHHGKMALCCHCNALRPGAIRNAAHWVCTNIPPKHDIDVRTICIRNQNHDLACKHGLCGCDQLHLNSTRVQRTCTHTLLYLL